jgi:ABC-type antimicrobial peptide transport system permease subunit
VVGCGALSRLGLSLMIWRCPAGISLVTAMLILAIVIALLGVVNTLALSISERTREIGLLRAIGMQRGQLRQMVAAESMIISVIGALLGIMLGLGLGAALAAALTRSQQATVAIPAGQLVVYIAAIAAAGVLAGITQPTLVANGSNDIMVSTVNSYLLAGHIPDAELIIYPDANHGFLFQYPHEFAAEVNTFLSAA